MKPFYGYMNKYRKQIEKDDIQEAYRGLLEYIMDLRTYFHDKYPDYFVSANIYYGYMDMTYFSFITNSLKRRKLRVAFVFFL